MINSNLTQDQLTKAYDFLSKLHTEVSVTDYVNIEDIDFENAFESIYSEINENGGFDIEIIYYTNAIQYLKENDPSLMESLEIAEEYGYNTKSLNSELLASLLASKNARESFVELESEINDFFAEMLEEIEENQ